MKQDISSQSIVDELIKNKELGQFYPFAGRNRSKIAEKEKVVLREKDWWVTLVLKAVFLCPCDSILSSKVAPHSEDIDIALAPETFGREYRKAPSNS